MSTACVNTIAKQIKIASEKVLRASSTGFGLWEQLGQRNAGEPEAFAAGFVRLMLEAAEACQSWSEAISVMCTETRSSRGPFYFRENWYPNAHKAALDALFDFYGTIRAQLNLSETDLTQSLQGDLSLVIGKFKKQRKYVKARREDPWCFFDSELVGELDWERDRALVLAERSAMTNGAARSAPTQAARLSIDLASNTLTLDNRSWPGLDPNGLRIIDHLRKLPDGRCITRQALPLQVPGCSGGPKTVDRDLKRLPEPVKALAKSKRGTGLYFQLPPNPKEQVSPTRP